MREYCSVILLVIIHYIYIVIEPTFGEFFYVSYAVLPISATQFYVYFQLKESIKVYVLITPNKAYSYHGVDMFIGKFNGHINLFDIYNMAAINYIIDHNYWYICRLYNEPRMACDCGINKYVHYNGGCSGKDIYIYTYTNM